MGAVALRKESVDRNYPGTNTILSITASLSARRAWIEILTFPGFGMEIDVALRKESVDRNISEDVSYNIIVKSLSARRAWIEIKSELRPLMASLSRSPQGERG